MTNKNNARSAIETAKANTAKALAEKQAATKAATTTEAAAKTAPATETKPEIDYQSFKGKVCKVVKGRKNVGDTVQVYFVSKGSQYRKPVGMAVYPDGTNGFVTIGNLEITGDMDAALAAKLNAEREAKASETLYVVGLVTEEKDNAVQLKIKGAAKRIWFAKPGMFSTTGASIGNEDVFEVAAWKIVKECGSIVHDALMARQDELETLVNAA